MTKERQELPLPSLEFFQAKNPYTGSAGEFRYRVASDGELLTAWVYEHDCFEVADPFCQGEFPVTQEGMHRLGEWLYERWMEYRASHLGE